jgi:uncharacterized protein YjiS (DUF1127 family)
MLLSAFITRSWDKIRLWREISHERSELRRLSEFIAKDIGISRAEAEREADRPFWDTVRGASEPVSHGAKAAARQRGRCLQAR